MGLTVCVLASGSSGNCTYVGSAATRVLIDAGLSCRETARRLGELGIDLQTIGAVCLTHEHEDHTAGVAVLHRRFHVPLYANAGTIQAIEQAGKITGIPWNVFTTGATFSVGELSVEPFSVPHDSYDPVGFVVRAGDSRVGVVTDMGLATNAIRERLRNCQAVILEANHDEQMLKDSERPWSLKQRIAGRQGHLSNLQAATLIREIAGPRLQSVVLAHLSRDCNSAELAEAAVRKALSESGFAGVAVSLTHADHLSPVIEVP